MKFTNFILISLVVFTTAATDVNKLINLNKAQNKIANIKQKTKEAKNWTGNTAKLLKGDARSVVADLRDHDKECLVKDLKVLGKDAKDSSQTAIHTSKDTLDKCGLNKENLDRAKVIAEKVKEIKNHNNCKQ